MEQKKLKTLFVLDILRETDEEHPITTNQIVDKLRSYGVEAERKSVLRDISLLKEYYNSHIELSQDNKLGFYMASREFEDWEIKLLCDAAGSAKFLTPDDRRTLISKLCGLTSVEMGKRIKAMTAIKRQSAGISKSKTKINIDTTMQAIKQGKQITFKYAAMTLDKKEELKRNGYDYQASPYAIFWKDDAYQLAAVFGSHKELSIYRLDRMRDVVIKDEPSVRLSDILGSSPHEKLQQSIENRIYNYTGDKTRLLIKTYDYMLDALYEQFGTILSIQQVDDHLEVSVETENSNGLYYWLLQYGKNVTVIEPQAVREKMRAMIRKIYINYKDSSSSSANSNHVDK